MPGRSAVISPSRQQRPWPPRTRRGLDSSTDPGPLNAQLSPSNPPQSQPARHASATLFGPGTTPHVTLQRLRASSFQLAPIEAPERVTPAGSVLAGVKKGAGITPQEPFDWSRHLGHVIGAGSILKSQARLKEQHVGGNKSPRVFEKTKYQSFNKIFLLQNRDLEGGLRL